MIRYPSRTRASVALRLLSIAALLFAQAVPAAAQETARDADSIDLQRLQELFNAGEETFFTADQPASIETFSRIIDRISALPGTRRTAELQRLLVDSLSYRARAQLNLGEDAAAGDDLRRILDLEPAFEFDAELVAPKLVNMFAELRDRLVGRLAVDASPADARLFVDGRLREWRNGPVPLRAGDHVVSVERPGYTVMQREVSVQAGEEARVEARLERTHPVVVLLARPPGATVSVDGRELGEVRRPRPTDLEDVVGEEMQDHPRLEIDEVQVGTHTLRVDKEGFRPLEQSFDLPELADYRLGPVELEPAAGTLLLRNVPEGASIELEGVDAAIAWERQRGSAGTGQRATAELGPGIYSLVVEDAGGARFETEAEVLDGVTTEVDVDLRPTIAYLGVLGGDDLGRDKIESIIRKAFGRADGWTFHDRRAAAEEPLDRLQLGAGTFRDLAAAGPRAWEPPFARLQTALAEETSGAVHVLGVLSDDLVATAADLWLLPGAPGPAHPDRITLDLDRPEGELVDRVATIFAPFEPTRPRLGASAIDTGVVDLPVIFEVTDDSPAARAGLQHGDLIRSVDGRELGSATELQRWIAEAGPEGELLVVVERGAQSVEMRIPLEASLSVVPPDPSGPPLAPLWTQIGERLRRPEEEGAPPWLLELNRVAILIRASRWEEAVQSLRRIRAPERPGVGSGMVDYWLGTALQALGDDYEELALEAFERAASQRQARLFHADGPYVWPRAMARADALRR